MKTVALGCVVAVAVLVGLGIVVAVMGETAPSPQTTPPPAPPTVLTPSPPSADAHSDRWTKETMRATAVDVPGFTKRIESAWQNEVGAGVRVAYASSDGYTVLLLATWERGMDAIPLDQLVPSGVDVTTKKPVKCSFGSISGEKTLNCSSYGAYARSTQWNVGEAMFTVAIGNPIEIPVARSEALVAAVSAVLVPGSLR